MSYLYGKFNRGHGTCPLYGGCPLLGESVTRGFTVLCSKLDSYATLYDCKSGREAIIEACVLKFLQVGTDFLEESIVAFEDCVQSVDIAAFNKI